MRTLSEIVEELSKSESLAAKGDKVTRKECKKLLREELSKDYPEGIPWTLLLQLAYYAWQLWKALKKETK